MRRRRLQGWTVGGQHALIGNVFDDVSDAVSDVGDVVTGTWDDIKNTVPGLGPISDALDSFATGPLRDFANTAVGHVVLFAVSGGVYMAAYPAVGAQLAAAAFALPGMAKGEAFAKAWTEGMVERVTMLIKYFIGQGIPDELATTQAGQIAQGALDKLNSYASQYNIDKLDFHQLAKVAGVREDFAALYLAQELGDMSIYTSHTFDEKTGKEFVGQSILANALKKIQEAQRQEMLAQQRAASHRSDQARDLGSFRSMLQPVATETKQAAQQAAAVARMAPPIDRSVAPPADAGSQGLSTGAKVALSGVGVGALWLILRSVLRRR